MSFLRRRGAFLGTIAAAGIVIVGLALTLGLSSQDERPASAAANGGLPTETPRRNLPKVLDGSVRDSARVGDAIVVGGDFTQVQRPNGQVINVSGIYAYDINTGSMITGFNPVLARNSGGMPEVLAIEPAGPDTVFLGGKFGSVNGHAHRRLTKVNVNNGATITAFTADFDGPVRDIVVKNNRLFAGGEFNTVNGQTRRTLVEMNATTGAVDAGFRADITGSTHAAGEPFGPKYLGITPNNILVVAHRGTHVGGQERPGLALINLANDSVLGWRTNFWQNNAGNTVAINTVDAEVSPDGTYVVLAGDGGDFPFWGRDSAVAFNITALNGGNQQPRWIARNFDSTYAVGISNDAVFLGGHFCWVEGPQAADPYPGDGEFTNNNSCFGSTPAGRFAPQVVNRDQIAAFDPATGKALDWDPGSDGIEGVLSIEVIGRGLLVGHDGEFFGRDGNDRRAWPVGRHGFLDNSVPDGLNTSLAASEPVVGTCNGLAPTMTGTNGNDLLVGTDGDDVILAGEGLDEIYGLGGNDTICGNRDGDVIDGGNGNDVIFGNEGADRLIGGFGNDDLRGGYWRDTLIGGAGNDVMRGGRGTDVLQGGAGNDTGYGNDGMDSLDGGAGNDTLFGQQGRDTVQGNSGIDKIFGGIGNDRCSGAVFGRAETAGDTRQGCERTS